MRFAFKTSPQNTTWADMLAVWQAADDIERVRVGLDLRPLLPDLLATPTGPVPRGLDRRSTALAQATDAAAARRAGHRHPLPPPRGAGQHGRHARHHLRRPARARHRRRAGTRRSPAPTASSWARLTERFDRFDEACEVIVGLLTQETHRLRRRATTSSPTPAASPSRSQRPHPPICIGGSGEKRTLRTAARCAQHWNFAGGTPEEFARKRDVLHAHCADIGRDPAEILLSSHVRLRRRPGRTAAAAAALGEAGLDLAIVYLRRRTPPPCWTPPAKALAQLP